MQNGSRVERWAANVTLAVVGFAVLMLLGVVIRQWVFVPSMVVSYGDPAKTYFRPAKAVEGSTVEICFDDLVWYRLCKGQLATYLTPPKGHRLDFDLYTISTPAKTGRVTPKCRRWTVPVLGLDREAGVSTLDGVASFECANPFPFNMNDPITVQLPSVKIDIQKR